MGGGGVGHQTNFLSGEQNLPTTPTDFEDYSI